MRNLARFARRDDRQRDRQYGPDDVRIERHTGIAGCEVSRDHHLSDVPDRITEQEDGSGAKGGRLNARFCQNAMQAPYADPNWKGD
jgi:hypothetical protein